MKQVECNAEPSGEGVADFESTGGIAHGFGQTA